MLKRPHKRIPVSPHINDGLPVVGSVVDSIINNRQVTARPPPKSRFGYQNVELYKRLLKANYVKCNVPYKEPDVIESRGKDMYTTHEPECHVDYLDKVYVKLNILKSGKVRIKIVTNFLYFWSEYYSKGKSPTYKTLVAAYKAVGYSPAFLKKMNDNFKVRQKFAGKLEKMIADIFDKKVTRKKVTKKVVKVVDMDEDAPDIRDADEVAEDEHVEEDGPEEDEALIEEDDECEVEDDAADEEYIDKDE
jgi:hypothetical protein